MATQYLPIGTHYSTKSLPQSYPRSSRGKTVNARFVLQAGQIGRQNIIIILLSCNIIHTGVCSAANNIIYGAVGMYTSLAPDRFPFDLPLIRFSVDRQTLPPRQSPITSLYGLRTRSCADIKNDDDDKHFCDDGWVENH